MLNNTPVCNFGWKAPEFTLKGSGGKSFTMSEQLGGKGLLIAFICNHCPYVQAIVERLASDTQQLMDEGINVLGVMSNDYQQYQIDSPPNMKIFAGHFGLNFP
jgi:peroxiredoxin